MRRIIGALCLILLAVFFIPRSARAKTTRPHIFLIVMENTDTGAYSLPYISQLAQGYGAATQYFAQSHPSRPNYEALFAGDLAPGCDCAGTVYDFSTNNLGEQLTNAGISWAEYADGLPSTGYLQYGGQATGVDGDVNEQYQEKHAVAADYASQHTATGAAHIQPMTNLVPLLSGPASGVPSFDWIIPNMCDDMHDCSPQTGDTWLSKIVPQIIASPAYQANGTIVITWDEAAWRGLTTPSWMPTAATPPTGAGGGRVATLILSSRVAPGTRYREPVDHYSLLRAIETAYGLPLLGGAQTAPDWTALDALLQPQTTGCGSVDAQEVDKLSAPPAAALDFGNGRKVGVYGLGGTGSVGIAHFSGGCMTAWIGPSQTTHQPPTFTTLELAYCGFGDFTLNWGTANPPAQTYDATTGCVTTEITPTTDPPLSAFSVT